MNYKKVGIVVSLFFNLNAEKYIIDAHGCGFFADFFKVLNHLVFCEKYSWTPVVYWGEKSLYYQQEGFHGQTNVWEYYFKPVSKAQYKGAKKIKGNSFKNPVGWFINTIDEHFIEQNRLFLKSIIDKYIALQPWIEEEYIAFYNAHLKDKHTIGIHVRGTDKYMEASPVPLEIFIETALKVASQFSEVQFLVATDQETILQFLKKHLPGKVIYYPALRSTTLQPLHQQNIQPARIGKEVLIEMLLLSKCDFFIHAQSNVALAALFFNPTLPHLWLKTEHQMYQVMF